ncbi:hypothetical protein B0H13DRAFT_1605723, partial [Mycena leptocephala]
DEADEGVQAAPLDEYDNIFGDGLDLAGLDLPDDSAVNLDEAQFLKNFDAEINAATISACGCCREEGFNIKLKASGDYTRCHSDRKEIKTWSDENNVNLMPENLIPGCLKNPTEMEKMLISRVKPVMQVRWTRGRQLCYKDHVINFIQDISVVAETLPRLPEDVDMVIIRREMALQIHAEYPG